LRLGVKLLEERKMGEKKMKIELATFRFACRCGDRIDITAPKSVVEDVREIWMSHHMGDGHGPKKKVSRKGAKLAKILSQGIDDVRMGRVHDHEDVKRELLAPKPKT
jgi:hypothetical protein